MTKATKPPIDARKRDLARIHILLSRLGIDRDIYEDILWVHGQVRSAADLDSHGRRQVAEHLERLLRDSQRARDSQHPALPYPGRPHNADSRAMLSKIEALLTDAGLPWSYADGIVRHMTRGRVERIAFADHRELAAVITALDKSALKRLTAECEATWGPEWPDVVQPWAVDLFGLAPAQQVTSSAQAMSQVLRWWRGCVLAVCDWPRRSI